MHEDGMHLRGGEHVLPFPCVRAPAKHADRAGVAGPAEVAGHAGVEGGMRHGDLRLRCGFGALCRECTSFPNVCSPRAGLPRAGATA